MIQSVVVIGTGRLAQSIIPLLQEKDIKILQVSGRKSDILEVLKIQYNVSVVTGLGDISKDADAYLLCVNDDAISEVSKQLSLVIDSDKFIFHFSGTEDYTAISDAFKRRVVLWPLFSFNFEHGVDWNKIPCFLSCEKEFEQELESWLHAMKLKYYFIEGNVKKYVHLSAVIANNFSNFNLVLAQQILNKNKLPLEVLHPIMSAAVEEAFRIGPENSQTGPARRMDLNVIEKQIELLGEIDPDVQKIYSAYSKLIIEYYHSQNKD